MDKSKLKEVLIILKYDLDDFYKKAYNKNYTNKNLLKKNYDNAFKQLNDEIKHQQGLKTLEMIREYLDNFEIVQIQLNECHLRIEKALNSNYQKLIIVHGIGAGSLKTEVHKLLRNYNLRFYLSKDAGATEVML